MRCARLIYVKSNEVENLEGERRKVRQFHFHNTSHQRKKLHFSLQATIDKLVSRLSFSTIVEENFEVSLLKSRYM